MLKIFTHQLSSVATVLTVYGIETHVLVDTEYLSCPSAVATVLTVYGIETLHSYPSCRW